MLYQSFYYTTLIFMLVFVGQGLIELSIAVPAELVCQPLAKA
jgi:hypothetical protein